MNQARIASLAVFALLLGAVLAACGGGDGTTAATEATAAAEGGDSVVADAEAAVAAATAPTETWTGPETSPKAATGKTVYAISCSPEAEGCQRDTDGAIAAAQALGWNAEKIDTDGSAKQLADAIEQALNSGADGIVLASIPAQVVEPQIAKAAAKGVPVVSMISGSEPPEVGADFEGGFLAEVGPDLGGQGELNAQWIIANTDGAAKIGILNEEFFSAIAQRLAGFEKVFGTCEGCEVLETINVPLTNIAKDATPAVLQFLRANPEANYFLPLYDAGAIFAVQAVDQAGRKGEVPIVSNDANSPNVEFIREGNVQVATVASPLEWAGWAAADQLNRFFNGEEPAPEWSPGGGGLPFKLLTQENLPPKGEYYEGDYDYQAKFEELWGVG